MNKDGMTRIDKMAKTKGMILLHMLGLLFLLLSLGGYLAWRLNGSLRFHNLALLDAEAKEMVWEELEEEAEAFYKAFLACQVLACDFAEAQPELAWIEQPFSTLFDTTYTHNLLAILTEAQKEKQWVKFTGGPKGYYYFALWAKYDTFLGLAYLLIPKDLEEGYLWEGRFYQLNYKEETALITLYHNQQTQSFSIQSSPISNAGWQNTDLLAHHHAQEGLYFLTQNGELWGVELESFFRAGNLTPVKVATVDPWFSEDTLSEGGLSLSKNKAAYLLYKIGRDLSLVRIEYLDTHGLNNNLRISQVMYTQEGSLKKNQQQIFAGLKGLVAEKNKSISLASELPKPLLENRMLFLHNSKEELVAVVAEEGGIIKEGELISEAFSEDRRFLERIKRKLEKSKSQTLEDVFKERESYLEYQGRPQFYYQIID